MAAILVREATPDDTPGVTRVAESGTRTLRETYHPKPGANVPPSRSAVAREGRLVAVIDKTIVGTVRYRDEDERLHLLGLAVDAPARRRGVARALIASLEEIARQRGKQRLSLFTISETGNPEVFRKLGFHVVSESEDSFAESDRFETLHEAYMERNLNPRAPLESTTPNP